MLAHELRNPLAPIRNAVEIMRMSSDAATQARARELIGRQAEHLGRLVDDLLEMSRITQGKVVLQPRVVSLRSLVDSALEVARAYAEKNGQELEVRMPEDEVWLEVDPVRISQVIGNLLHNASKFTPKGGGVSLDARLVPEGVQLQVADTGVGIAPELLRNIFDLFSQADRSLDRAQGGLGIGLSLVRGLVEMHGGRVAAQSEGPGKGSVFRVLLPRSRIVGAPDPGPEAARGPATGRRRILVVEDNPDSAEAMVALLRELGHEVAMVGDGMLAVGVARQFEPEVILLDIGLPGIDGYELARRLRSDVAVGGAHMIAITGYGQPADRERALAAGFDQHLVKPVDPARLAAAVNESRGAVA
jgi:two-component system CheB/CheR fusion protein